MSIISIQTVSAGLVGVLPSMAYIYTDYTVAQISVPGFLNHEVQLGASFSLPCMALVSTRETPTSEFVTDFYEVTHVSGNWSLSASATSTVVGTLNRITVTGGAAAVVDIASNYVGQTSLTTLGTITTGVWHGTVIGATYGGTGVNNGSSTLTLGGNLATSGAFASTFTMTGATSVTFPTSGTLATTAGTASTITGTTNQVLVNGTSGTPTSGAITLTLPQSIATTSSPTFASLTLSNLLFTHETNLATDSFPTVTLTTANKQTQYITYTITGDGIQFVLPDATTLAVGRVFEFIAVNSPDANSCVISSAGAGDYNSNIPALAASTGSAIFTLVNNSTTQGIWNIEVGLPINSFPLAADLGGTGFGTITQGAALIGNTSNTWLEVGSIPGNTTFGGMLAWGFTSKVTFTTSTARNQPFCSGNAAAGSPGFLSYGMPFSFGINQLVYFSGAQQMAGLATGNNGLLVTGASGIPAISNVIPIGVTVVKASGAESSNAITLNGSAGVITTASLTTAAGGSYAITWTNSQITSASNFSFCLQGGTNTSNDLLFKCAPGSGTATLTIYNTNAVSAFNGTLLIGYYVY